MRTNHLDKKSLLDSNLYQYITKENKISALANKAIEQLYSFLAISISLNRLSRNYYY